MGEAADDAFYAAYSEYERNETMRLAGAKRCRCMTDFELAISDAPCPTCHDLGWIDANGRPCEP